MGWTYIYTINFTCVRLLREKQEIEKRAEKSDNRNVTSGKWVPTDIYKIFQVKGNSLKEKQLKLKWARLAKASIHNTARLTRTVQ